MTFTKIFFFYSFSSSFVVSIFCLGVCVVAIIFSVEYHDEFKRFSLLNRQQVEGGYCDQSVGDNQCMCFSGRTLQVFRDGFKCKNYSMSDSPVDTQSRFDVRTTFFDRMDVGWTSKRRLVFAVKFISDKPPFYRPFQDRSSSVYFFKV